MSWDDEDICPEVRDVESGVWDQAFSLSGSMHDKYDVYCANTDEPMSFDEWHEWITNKE
jgi:hypothetical protein